MKNIKKLFSLLSLLLVIWTSNAQEKNNEANFYISTQGSDKWSGQLAEPNTEGTDGPFATLEQARKSVRDLNKKSSKDITVLIREGVTS